MLEKMKKQMKDDIAKAKESGELTAHKVYEIARKAMSELVQSLKSGEKDLREIATETVNASVQTLVEAKEANKETISAAIHGLIDGIKQGESNLMEKARKELNQSKRTLQAQEKKLAVGLNEAFEGAKEAAGNFSITIKDEIEAAVSDTKLKSTELLGLTKKSVKAAVGKAIETGSNVEETVEKVTRNATAKAMEEAHFTADRVRNISEAVLSGAVEAAEELKSFVSETTHSAVDGVHQGLTDSVEFTRNKFVQVGDHIKEFGVEDLIQTKDDLDAVGELFVEILRKVADKSGKVAGDILHEVADDAKKSGSRLQENASKASHAVAKKIRAFSSEALEKAEEVGSKAMHSLSKEAKELSERMIAVTKGAATGMWEGAKAGFHKETDKEEKS